MGRRILQRNDMATELPHQPKSMADRRISAAWIFFTFSAALIFPILLTVRYWDDNTLTSWRWVYAGADLGRIYGAHLSGLALAALLACGSAGDRWHYPLLFLGAFLAATGAWAEPEVIIDAARYFTQAKYHELYGAEVFFRQWGRDLSAWTDLPIVPFIYGLIFRLFGEHRLGIQVFTTLLFALSALLTAGIGRILWSRKTGVYAGWLLLGIPYLLTQVPLLLVDVPTMFFITLALFAVLLALEGGGSGRLVLAALAIAAALLAKYSTWVLLASLMVPTALVAFRRWGRRALKRAFFVSVLAAVFVCPFLLLKSDVVIEQLRLLATYQREGLKSWGESPVSVLLFQAHPFLALFALLGLREGWKKKDAATLIIAWLPALLLLMQVRRGRYLMPAFPMLALLAACGLQVLREPRLRKFIVGSAVSFSLVTALLAYRPFLRAESASNLQEAGAYLNARGITEAEVVLGSLGEAPINPLVAVPLLDYFTSTRLYLSTAAALPLPPPGQERSPFRFTWEYKSPGFYAAPLEKPKTGQTMVYVSGNLSDALSPGMGEKPGTRMPDRVFAATGLFSSKTFVGIYLAPGD